MSTESADGTPPDSTLPVGAPPVHPQPQQGVPGTAHPQQEYAQYPGQQHGYAQHPGQHGYAQPPYPGAPGPQRPPSGGPIWVGLLAILLGVAGFIIGMIPGEMTFRIIISSVGLLLTAAGVVLGIVAAKKRWRTGLAIAGICVSGIAFLLGAAILGLGILASYQLEAAAERNQAELEARLAEEQAAEDEIFGRSQWIEDELSRLDPADFTAVDAARLSEILADPEAHTQEGIIVNATMPEMLINPGLAEQGLCVTGVSLYADGSQADVSNRARVIDRGTENECPLTDRLMGLDEGLENLGENMTAEHRMYLVPASMAAGPDDEGIPTFLLYKIEG